MKPRSLVLKALPFVAIVCAGCPAGDEVTSQEAQEIVEETALASQASSVAEGSIELTTSFTLGGAVENAAEEIVDFVKTELPCAEVSREGATVSITYGANGDTCTWHGAKLTGTHTVTIERAENDDVLVHHAWDHVSNGRVSVDGSADVTWSAADKSRHVVHELTWTRLSDGRTGTGSGDRLQSPLDGSWTNGIDVDGSRTWKGDAGTWTLAIHQVEWRWIDPVPESGSYVVTTPAGKQITLEFERTSETKVHVTVDGTRRDFEFDVGTAGDIE